MRGGIGLFKRFPLRGLSCSHWIKIKMTKGQRNSVLRHTATGKYTGEYFVLHCQDSHQSSLWYKSLHTNSVNEEVRYMVVLQDTGWINH